MHVDCVMSVLNKRITYLCTSVVRC